MNARITILSSPDERDLHNCVAGKNQWLDHWLGDTAPRRLFKTDKAIMCRPGDVLVDDNERHCREWIAAGGYAILFKGQFDDEFWDILEDVLMHD
jgi:hypothetical protein